MIGQTIFKERFGKYQVGDELPEGRRVGKIKDFVDILSGFAFKSSDFVKNGTFRLITIANVQDGAFIETTKDGLDIIPDKMPEYCKLKTSDILLSLTGNVGRICLVIGKNYLLNQRVAKLQPKVEQDFAYVYLFFRQPAIVNLLENISSGTAQQNLSPINTANLETVIPSKEIFDKF
ncbi:MAG: restriction endonuclease subunit S [Candidatus Peribacteria bacterium]|nr:restriction endonuclease subunit S [Candidatus Peribacteria bacterium]